MTEPYTITLPEEQAMFGAFVAFLRMLWPFVKESILQDGTFRDWVRRNKNVCIFLVFQIVMLLSMLWLVDMLKIARQMENKASSELIELRTEHKNLKTAHETLGGDLKKERATSARMRAFLAKRCMEEVKPACEFLVQETIQPETPETPPTQKAVTINTEWCKLVQSEDLQDGTIRLRFLKECSAPTTDPQPTGS